MWIRMGSPSGWIESGSGFKSLRSYTSGYFGASIKLQAGYTAGVIACLYLSNNEAIPGKHDEIDMEFLGQTNEEPYVLQTNVYMNGSGDGNLVGREMRFHLWFDPTAAFHHYAILWNPQEIIFLVDDIPIRKYKKRSTSTFPLRPMWVYGSIWDASSWATDNGKYKADYSYQPFIARYKDFKISGCDAAGNSSCRPATASPTGAYGLSDVQHSALRWVQRSYVIYYYCHDLNRDHSVTPECGGE